MRWPDKLRLRLRSVFRRQTVEQELDRELRFHLEQQIEENIAAGMDAVEARQAALRAFGGIDQHKEECRDSRGIQFIDNRVQDLRYAFRTLARNPGFAVVAIVTLGIGIGANTAILSVIDRLLFRNPPFEHIDRLVYLVDTHAEVPADVEVGPSPGNFLDWRLQARSFDEMAAWRNWYYTLSESQGRLDPELVRGVRVSPSFFVMLGTKPQLGRIFLSDEEETGRDQSVILSDSLWRHRFGANAAIIGTKALIDGQPLTVVGVLPPDFRFYQSDFDLWMPLTTGGDFHNRQSHSVMVFARLAPNVSINQAQAEMNAIAHGLEQQYTDTNAGWGARIVPLYPGPEARNIRRALVVLLVGAIFLLLIACVNIANLLLVRAFGRHREMTIRAAVGATRGRLIGQMLTETTLIAVMSGVLGVLMAQWAVQVLIPLLPHADVNTSIGGFQVLTSTIDTRVLVFSLFITLVTEIAFGLVPAFRTSRPDFLRVPGASGKRQGAGRLLMTAEIALSLMLLIGAALFLETFWNLQATDTGFRTDHLLTMQVWLPKPKYPEPDNIRSFYEQVLRRVEVLPGVQGAGAVSFRPFNGMSVSTGIEIEGRSSRRADDTLIAGYSVVTPGYVSLLGQRLIRGRDFLEDDADKSGGVALINQAMAQRFWPNEDPLGKRIRPGFSRTDTPWAVDSETRWLTIVGIVSNVKESRRDETTRPALYVSYRQFPSSLMFLIVRTTTPPQSLINDVQNEIRAVDPHQPVANVRTMDESISAAIPRFNVQVLGFFASVGLLLSALGVYGVTSYAVRQRKQEIAVRMALGAKARDVLVMMLREVLAAALIGIAAGVIGGVILTRTLTTLLYGVAPSDTATFAGVSALLLSTVLAACYVPVRRATKVDPMVALRQD